MAKRFKISPMTSLERRAVSGLAVIFALRMLGFFMILPVFAIYADSLEGHTPLLVGLALGAYGLTQALFQIPLGVASDHIGRKPIIIGGLMVFVLGSVVAALADSITGVIVGRALQGTGAIAAAVIALASDLTRDDQRTKAMAIIGITIGGSFIVALIVGPLLGSAVGLSGIFWFTAVLALAGMAVMGWWVPAPQHSIRHQEAVAVPAQLAAVLRTPELLRLDLGIFILHAVLTALFVVIPLALVSDAGLGVDKHWQVYVPVMLASILFIGPAIMYAERKQKMRRVFVGAVLLLAVSQGLLAFGHNDLWPLVTGIFLFFVAFNFLEAALPSLVSRHAPADSRGSAVGVYSTFQFLGAFVGGVLGGGLYGAYGMEAVFTISAGLLLLWAWVASGMTVPPRLSMRTVQVGPQDPEAARFIAEQLAAVPGVREAVVAGEEGMAYLKVDEGELDPEDLHPYRATSA
ncbi:MAG: MFS transporter [Gammaproteobacteria bacterium]|nr:MAG: MFS transporter [Gammaproteobacteria bacterium]